VHRESGEAVREYWAVRVTFYDGDRPVEHWFQDFGTDDVPYYTVLKAKRFEFAVAAEAHECRDGIAKLDATLAPAVVHVRVVPR
jgi:hypothetical protein